MEKRKIEHSRVLVTGGAGFIGSNLCETLLEQHNEVICLDNLSTGSLRNLETCRTHSQFTFLEADIRDLSACQKAADGIDYVFHQAALGSVPRSIDDPITTNSVNINGFLNMILASRDAKVKRFIYATSSSVYGTLKTSPKVEEYIGKPLSPYAITKYVNELYAGVFHDLYAVECIGLRYFNVFGRKQNPEGAYAAAIPRFVSALIRHEAPVIYGDGNQSRDFTYIDNVIQANQLAALTDNREALNQVYNVANGSSTSVNDLVMLLRQMLSEFDPEIADVASFYGPERVGDVRDSLASIERIKTYLDYQPQDDLKSGLQKAIKWYWKNLQQQVS